MNAEWHRLCRAKGLLLEDSQIVVELGSGRHHRVSVEDHDDSYAIRGIVARPGLAAASDNLAFRAWQKNRAAHLVGFLFDERGRLVGEACLPKAGMTAVEFQLYVRTVAAECDRFEYLLTGRDNE